jgi:hypothetical protein
METKPDYSKDYPILEETWSLLRSARKDVLYCKRWELRFARSAVHSSGLEKAIGLLAAARGEGIDTAEMMGYARKAIYGK